MGNAFIDVQLGAGFNLDYQPKNFPAELQWNAKYIISPAGLFNLGAGSVSSFSSVLSF